MILEINGAKSYSEVGEALLQRGLVNPQESSYLDFLLNSVKDVLSRKYSRKIFDNVSFDITFKNFYFDDSSLFSESYCLSMGKSREVSLFADMDLKLYMKQSNDTVSSISGDLEEVTLTETKRVEVTRIPVLCSGGSFIVNGNRKDLVLHAERLPFIRGENCKYLSFTTLNGSRITISTDEKEDYTLNRSGSSEGVVLKISEKVGTRLQTKKTTLSGVLGELGIHQPYAAEAILGNNPKLLNQVNSRGKSDQNTMESLYKIELTDNERKLLNHKTSFKELLTSKRANQDIADIIHNGEVISAEKADYLQDLGYSSIKVSSDNFKVVIMNNNFVDPYIYLFDKNSLIPEPILSYFGIDRTASYTKDEKTEILNSIFPGTYRDYDPMKIKESIFGIDEIKLTQAQLNDSMGYRKINAEEFCNIVTNYVISKNYDVRSCMDSNKEIILGKVFIVNDAKAFINQFSLLTLLEVPPDDKDSMGNRTVASVNEIFTSLLLERISGNNHYNKEDLNSKGAEKSSIIESIRKEISSIHKSLGREGDVQSLDLSNLDCGTNTITSRLLNSNVSKLFNEESNMNNYDKINSKRKITLRKIDGRGGISEQDKSAKPREVNFTQVGRVDLIETPESKNVGLDLYLASTAIINKFGLIEAPFLKIDKVKKEILLDKVYYMDAYEESKYKRIINTDISDKDYGYISVIDKGIEVYREDVTPIFTTQNGVRALNNAEDLEIKRKQIESKYHDKSVELFVGKRNWFLDNEVSILEDKKTIRVGNPEDADFVMASPFSILSPVTGSVPFTNYDDGTRLLMADSMTKQAEPTIGSEIPLIRTELSDRVGFDSGEVITAPFDCIVSYVDSTKIIIEEVREGDADRKINLEWGEGGFEFNADEDKPLSIMDIGLEDTKNKTEYVINLNNYGQTSSKTLSYFTPSVVTGDFVLKGEILADSSTTKDGKIAIGTNLLVGYIPYKGYNYEDAIVISSRLVEEDILTSYLIEKHIVEIEKETLSESQGVADDDTIDDNGIVKLNTKVRKNDKLAIINEDVVDPQTQEKTTKKRVVTYTSEDTGVVVKIDKEDTDKKIIYRIYTSTREKIKIGDKLAGRHGNKGVCSRIVPHWAMPELDDGTHLDILLTPLGIPSRMNPGQILETQLGLVLKENNMTSTIVSNKKVDMPRLKRIINSYTGTEDGKVQLYDPKTGNPLMYRSTVGYATIYKLEHIASHKVFGRGRPGSEKTNLYTAKGLPTKGKARGGGMRIGEMESWSLQVHGAKDVMRELYSMNADDKVNRERANQERTDLCSKLSFEKPLTMDVPANGSDVLRDVSQYMAAMGINARRKDGAGKEVDILENRVSYDHTSLNKTPKVKNQEFNDLDRRVKLYINKSASTRLKKDEDTTIIRGNTVIRNWYKKETKELQYTFGNAITKPLTISNVPEIKRELLPLGLSRTTVNMLLDGRTIESTVLYKIMEYKDTEIPESSYVPSEKESAYGSLMDIPGLEHLRSIPINKVEEEEVIEEERPTISAAELELKFGFDDYMPEDDSELEYEEDDELYDDDELED